MRCLALLPLLIFVIGIPSAQAQLDPAYVWYGTLDGSPLEVPSGGEVLIPVYVQTPIEEIQFMDASVKLGVSNDYTTNITVGHVYSPLSEDYGAWDGPFDNGFVTSYEFTGECFPLLYFPSPILLIEFRVTISADPSLIGQTLTVLYAGYNPNEPNIQERYTYFRSDSNELITPIEYYSELKIVENEPQVGDIWRKEPLHHSIP